MDIFNSDDSTVSLEELSFHHNRVAMEAMNPSQSLTASTEGLTDFMSDTVRYLRNKLSIFTPHIYNVPTRDLERHLKTVDYSLMMSLALPVPEYFSSTWSDFTNVLAESQKIVMPIVKERLDPIAIFIGQTINNPEKMANVSVIASLPKIDSKEFEQVQQKLKNSFKGQHRGTMTYGELVQRNADVLPTIYSLNRLNDDFATLDRSKLVKKVQEITDLIATLIDIIKNDKTQRISGNYIKALSDVIYAVARDVEYYSAHGYRLDSFTSSVAQAVTKLNKVLSK